MKSFLEDLASRRRFGMKLGLGTIRALCAELGDPQKRFEAIHVAGTNGKGAVAAILSATLPGRVGRYTSPHLVSLNERFVLSGAPVSDARLARFAARVSRVAPKDLTFFEALTAVAFLLYADEKPDYTILETGLGGRLDATNICSPRLAIITKIGLDHCDWLGNTIEKIAAEKAGIIKKGVPILLGKNSPRVRKLIAARAREIGAPFYYAPEVASLDEIPKNFSLGGSFNRENAQTALAALKLILGETLPDSVRAGFGKVVWPGRFDRVRNFIVDGAHNPPAAEALVAAFPKGKVDLIAGFCGDKDVLRVLRILAPHIRKAYAVKTNNPRSLSADETASCMRRAGMDATPVSSLAEALRRAGSAKTLVCGSLFLAGEALVALKAYPWKTTRLDLSEQLTAMNTFSLVSLGCAKNAVDLQIRAGKLLKEGARLSSDPDRADAVIVNTCAFIESAREEAETEIRRALSLKKKGQFKRVVVTGCYPERYPQSRAAFPGVDEWIGVPKTWEEPAIPAFRLSGKAFAYLRIAEGCAHRCAYCAIPAIRGKYRSRPLKSILAEAKALLETGCRELDIVAQDPMLWCEGKKRLPDLLRAIDKLEGDFWVRVLYSYPSEITEDYLVWLMTSPHAARYVDIPLQHTVPEVLAKMNREAAIDASLSAADVLRELVPGITLRTTILVGFPGETEARFNRLRSDLKRMQFDHLGAFAYSPEEGTAGARMNGRPSRAVAAEREKLIMADAKALWRVRAKRFVGETLKALVVAPGVARLESQAPDVDGVVFLKNKGDVGEFVRVKILSVRGFDFIGKAVKS